MSLTQKIAIAAGALTLGVAGVAAASTTPSTTPDVADTGLTKASEVVVEQSADHGDATSADEGTDESSDDVDVESADNHGADVSAVAQTEFDSGREHGEAVSEVAKDNHGAEVSDDVEADEADDDADEVDDDTDEVENEHEDARP